MIRSKTGKKPGRDAAGMPHLRKPGARDGSRVWELVRDCPPLDRNSRYCNLLQCAHFADTSVLAECDGEAVGWISAYCRPGDATTLFVWQVAVHRDARGLGLARRMLVALLEREGLAGVRYLETTITPDNEASRALFRSLAALTDAPLVETPGFDEQEHFDGRHPSESLITIGPLQHSGARTAA